MWYAVLWPMNRLRITKRTKRAFDNGGLLWDEELTKALMDGELVPEAPPVPLPPPDGDNVTTTVPVPAEGDTNKDCEPGAVPAAGDPVPLGAAEFPPTADVPAAGPLLELELGGLPFIKGP
jgi:hypothetical protein